MERVTKGTVAAVVAAVLAGTGVAQAQDVRIETVVKEEIRRQIEREIDRVAIVVRHGDVGREIGRAIESALSGLDYPGSIDLQTRGRGNDNQNRSQDTRTEKRSLAIGASGSLELRNYGGDITVTAGSGNEATVEIVRRARGRSDAEVKTALDEVTVQVDHRGERASLQVVDGRARDRDRTQVDVSYTVTAPAGTRLNVNSLGATVRVTGIKGDVAIEVAGGDITVAGSRVSRVKSMGGDITLTDVDADTSLEVGTFGGDIVIERAKMRRLNAETMGGNLTARDIAADEATLKTLAGDVEYVGALARNGRYEFRTHSGDVRLTVPANAGFEIEATTFSGTVQPSAGLSLQPSANNRRSLRGVVGDGSARIIASALSGDVIIIKK